MQAKRERYKPHKAVPTHFERRVDTEKENV